MKTHNIFLNTIMLFVLCVPIISQAADSESSAFEGMWTRDKLFGDWGGLRSGLGKHGIAFDIKLSQFYQSVEDGGVNENDEYGGKVDYVVNVDGEKLGLWKGLFLNFHAETQFGHSITGDAGDLTFPNTAMLWPLPGEQSTEVTGWTVTQGVYQKGDTALALMAGKINALDLVDMVFPNVGGGTDSFMNTNVLVTALPWLRYVKLSMLGAGGLMLKDGKIQGGLIFLDSNNATNNTGFPKLGDNGFITVGLYRFFFDLHGKPGSLSFLAAGSTGEYSVLERTEWVIGRTPTSVFVERGVELEKERGPWSGGVYYDQILWQSGNKGERNVRFFTSVSIADDDPSFSDWSFMGQVEATGFFPSRPLDKMGIGGFYSGMTSKVKSEAEDLLGVSIQDLSGFEVYYSAAVTPSIHVTGDLQLINNPREVDDMAIIPGLRMVIDF
jgi:porin